jgi:4-amino-4-deoxy-L-arabinose transferase-like glycosyltransferase
MLVVVVFRLLGPDDLDTNDQAKQALYVLDVWDEGRWILPVERETEPATKPPLFTWLVVAFSVPFGRPTEISCRLPSVVAAMALTWLVFIIGRERWSTSVGVAAAWILATAHTAARLAIHVRPDMVLTLLTTAALFALHRLERGRGRGMVGLFWIATSLSILAKGPPGPLVIGAAILVLSASREWRRLFRQRLLSPWMMALIVPLAWFLLAIRAGGIEYLTGTVLPQTLERVLASGSRAGKAQPPGQLLALFAARFAPWSIVAFTAAVAALLGKDARARSRERNLVAAWLFGGLAVFSLSRGQREDYLLPLLPAAALFVASVLEPPCGRAVHRVWRLLLPCLAAGALGLGVAAALGLLERWVRSPGGGAWTGPVVGAILVASSALFSAASWSCWRPPRDGRVRSAPFYEAAAGVLVIIVGYYLFLSPDARSTRGPDLRAFAEMVNARRTPGDEVRLHGNLANGIRFLTGRNVRESSREEIGASLEAAGRRGNLLVITVAAGADELQAAWPRAFTLSVRHRHGTGGELVLLEAAALQGPGRDDPPPGGHDHLKSP